MLTVISPAKKLDMAKTDAVATQPMMQEHANKLAASARRLSKAKLAELMSLSDSLAKLNYDRFKAFEPESRPENSKPAALAFAGDTYTGLEAKTLGEDTMAYAQDHLRILSGLYGLLRPLDAIQPYRLEMGSRLKTGRANSLYAYWDDRLALALNAQAEAVDTEILLNCASQEYFGAVAPGALKLRVVTPSFLEDKPGGPKMVSFFAKQARGAMARFVLENRVTTLGGLQDFDTGGYAYQPDMSTPEAPVFVRPEAQSVSLQKAS